MAACDLCESTGKTSLWPDIDVVRCTSCGLVYSDLRVGEDDVQAIYDESYFRSEDSQELGYGDYLSQRPLLARTFARRLEEIEKRCGGRRGRLLDVGCAAGFFLDVARERGWKVQGIEISKWAGRMASERLGLDVFVGPLTGYPEPGPEARFDVITMWDMIEHAIGPKQQLAKAARLLQQDGLLVMATPDIGSWPARLSGRRWIGIKPHEHFYYFSRQTIGRLLDEAGFDVQGFATIGKHVSVDFLLERLGHYAPRLARGLRPLAARIGLAEHALYVDPRDMLVVYARRRSG